MNRRWDMILGRTEKYYAAKARQHGATARGVDWNSQESQELRFDQLLRLVESEKEPFSLNDYGCGYGALVEHLAQRGLEPHYHGFDISGAMIESARQRHAARPRCRFTTSFGELERATYTVASGVFNVKLEAGEDEWPGYVFHCLDQLHTLSSRGFAFNVLSQDSEPERRQPHLFYADPLAMLEHCRRRYSRRLALLQDYGLYEFTIVVRRDGSEKWPD